jgi:tetratricopeptide (TPR) repeat protein
VDPTRNSHDNTTAWRFSPPSLMFRMPTRSERFRRRDRWSLLRARPDEGSPGFGGALGFASMSFLGMVREAIPIDLMAAGYVYILLNPAMPDYLKIGKSARSSELRAAELSAATGVPTRFHVAYDVLVTDCDVVERLVHQRFELYRASDNREFFCVSLKDAIAALGEIASRFDLANDDEASKQGPQDSKASAANLIAWETLSDDGRKRVLRQYDSVRRCSRYETKIKTPDTAKDLLGFQYESLTTKWGVTELTLESALAASMISAVPRESRYHTHYDYSDGGYSYELRCSDGSCRTFGFEVNPMMKEWASLEKTRDWAAALTLAEKMILHYPDGSLSFLKKAHALRMLGKRDEARAILGGVIDRFPGDHLVLVRLAAYDCALGNLDRAKQWLKKGKKIAGKDGVRRLTVGDSDLAALQGYINGAFWW